MTMKSLAALLLLSIATPALAGESAGLMLPQGFHATIVADGLGAGARHVAVRANGDIYISTRKARENAESLGVIAVQVDKNHKAVQTDHFGAAEGGTGMRLYKGALYVAGPDALYRFKFKGNELTPSAKPDVIVSDLPARRSNIGIAFDGKGGLYVAVAGAGNICTDPNVPKDQKPVGLKPCPLLNGRAGMWRFDAEKTNQKFPDGGEQLATGVRDMMALDWSKNMKGVYGVMQGRNGTAKLVPGMPEESDTVAEEMHRIDKGADLGWPYTYYDTALKARVLAPEYGGDGKMPPPDGKYTTPVAGFTSHESPVDLQFYDGKQFPAKYRGGAFIAFQGGSGPEMLPQGRSGYNVTFVPFDKAGKPGAPEIFADNFAGPNPSDRNTGKAQFRPSGIAVAPDGSLYVVDTVKGRLWHIYYDGK
jgi:glucose/arabinose dehydrogenase